MKKWIAINLLLLAAAALLGVQLRKSVFEFKAENNLAKIQPAPDLKQRMLQEKTSPTPLPVKTYNPAEFSVIPDKNLFSPTRTKEDKVEIAAPPEAPPLAQKPILLGTAISDTERKASIIDPTAAADPRGRRELTRRVGDVYQGYTITEIVPDRIVLESGARKEVIPLREGSKRAQGGKTPILSTRVVPVGGGAVAGGTPVTALAGSGPINTTPATPARTGVTPIGGSTQTGTARPGTAASTAVPVAVTPSAQPPQQAQPGAQPATRIVRTPFGDYVRPAE